MNQTAGKVYMLFSPEKLALFRVFPHCCLLQWAVSRWMDGTEGVGGGNTGSIRLRKIYGRNNGDGERARERKGKSRWLRK